VDLEEDISIQSDLKRWEPVIALAVATADGDSRAAAQLELYLDHFAQYDNLATLVGVLRHILAGERGDGLLEGLNPADTVIARQVLTRLNPPSTAPAQDSQ